MTTSPVVALHTQPETARADARRALRLCAARRPAATAGDLVVVERTVRGVGATSAWALHAVLEHLEECRPGRDGVTVGARGATVLPTGEPSLDRALAAHGVAPEALAAEGSTRVDVEVPWLRGRRGTDVGVDPRVAGRNVWWAGPLLLERRHGWRGAVAGVLSLVARPEEWRDADPQTLIELYRLFEATVAGRTVLLDATVCLAHDGSARPQVHNLLLAGRDPIAVDAVAARLIGFDPERVAWLRGLAEGMRRDLTPGGIALRGGAIDAQDFQHASGRALPLPTRTGRRRAPIFDATGWWARWRVRRWDRLYARTPWGRLRDHERRASAPAREADR